MPVSCFARRQVIFRHRRNHLILNTFLSRRGKSLHRKMEAAVAAAVESLEARTLFATYIVTGIGDAAAGTITPGQGGAFNAENLRAAVNAANTNAGADEIVITPGNAGPIVLDA